MATSEPHQALYVGEGGTALGDGTPLIPGVTIVAVPAEEAERDDKWQPLTTSDPAASEKQAVDAAAALVAEQAAAEAAALVAAQATEGGAA